MERKESLPDSTQVEVVVLAGERPLPTDGPQPCLVQKSKLGFVGLMNQGATCYLNSLLQVLFMTPEFRNTLFEWTFNKEVHGEEELCIPRQLQLVFARLAHSRRPFVGTKALTKSFRWTAAESFRQHDIQELISVLFDALERSLRSSSKTFFANQLFQGELADSLACSACSYTRQRAEPFLNLNLVITGRKSLEDALSAHIREESIEGHAGSNVLGSDARTGWRCGGCDTKVTALKSYRFRLLPPLFTVHLRRFDYGVSGRVKVNSRLDFPTRLDMAPFMVDPSSAQRYLLYGVLMHSGTAMGGHYYAFARHAHRDADWAVFNDIAVEELPPDRFASAFGGDSNGASAYVLFYRREDWPLQAPVPLREDLREWVEHEDQVWEEEQRELERERRRLDLRVVFEGKETRLRMDKGVTVAAATDAVFEKVQPPFARADVRLRFFASELGFAQASFEGCEEESMEDCGFKRSNTLLLETREAGAAWPPYNPHAIPVRVISVEQSTLAALVDFSAHCLVGLAAPESAQFPLDTLVVDSRSSVSSLREQLQKLFFERGVLAKSDEKLLLVHFGQEDAPAVLAANELSLIDAKITAGAFIFAESDALSAEEGSAFVRAFEENRCMMTVEFNDLRRSTADEEAMALADPSSIYTERVRLSRTRTLAELKELLSSQSGVPVHEFRLRRNRGGDLLKDSSASLRALSLVDGSVVYAERGASLKMDEVFVSFTLYDPSVPKGRMVPLFDLPVATAIKVVDLKKILLVEINRQFPAENESGNVFELKHLRLRDRTIRRMGKIFQDGRSLKRNIPKLRDGTCVVVQKIDRPEHVTIHDVTIWMQQWHPKSQKFGKKTELLLSAQSKIGELCELAGKLGSIEVGNVGLAKGYTATRMKRSDVARLNFRRKLNPTQMCKISPLKFCDGDLILFQDNSVEVAKSETGKDKRVSRFGRKYGRGNKLKGVKCVAGGARRHVEHALRIYTEEDIEAQKAALEEFEKRKQAEETKEAS